VPGPPACGRRLAAAEAAIAPLTGAVVGAAAPAAPAAQGLRRPRSRRAAPAQRRSRDRRRTAGAARLAANFSGAGPEDDRLAAALANLALTLGAEAGSPEADVLRHAIASLIRS